MTTALVFFSSLLWQRKMCPAHQESRPCPHPWSWRGWSCVFGPVLECFPVVSAPDKHTRTHDNSKYRMERNTARKMFFYTYFPLCLSYIYYFCKYFTDWYLIIFNSSHPSLSPWRALQRPWSSSLPQTPSSVGEAVGWDLNGSWWKSKARQLRGWWGSEARCSRPPPPPYERLDLAPMGPQSGQRWVQQAVIATILSIRRQISPQTFNTMLLEIDGEYLIIMCKWMSQLMYSKNISIQVKVHDCPLSAGHIFNTNSMRTFK